MPREAATISGAIRYAAEAMATVPLVPFPLRERPRSIARLVPAGLAAIAAIVIPGDTPQAAPTVRHAMQWCLEAGQLDHAIVVLFPLGEPRVPLATTVTTTPVAHAQLAIFRVLARAVALYVPAGRGRVAPEGATRAISAMHQLINQTQGEHPTFANVRRRGTT